MFMHPLFYWGYMNQILFYNTGFIRQVIEQQPSILDGYLLDKDLFHFYDKHKMNLNVTYDRTGNVPHYLNIKSGLLQIPKVDSAFNKSFAECVEDRCKELLSLGKKINVVWSGGIDSTLVLCALLHFANDPSQIVVYGTYTSVLESGDFLEKRIIPRGVEVKLKVSSRRDFDDCSSDEIFVTGFFGNQLFGPTDNFSVNSTVKTDISFFHHQFNGDPLEDYTKFVDPELHEFLLPCIKASPKKIETLRDLRWWLIFNFDWYTAEFATRVNTNQQNNQYHFFNTDDFQRYVLTTKEPFTKEVGNPLTHRWVMRQLIEEWTGDSNYAWTKPKGVSNLGNPDPTWLLLLEDYSVFKLPTTSFINQSRITAQNRP
jgi:hypothetical protein